AGELRPLVEADLAACDRGPEPLLVLVEVLRVDPLPLALDDSKPPGDVGRHRHEPRDRRELATGAPLLPPAGCRRDASALAVEVSVEECVQRDDALVVRRRFRDEVDDDPGLLARVHAPDPSAALLVDA